MSQEIVDAVRLRGREKGISEEKLMLALEDALLSAYKKQPGAARYARVRMDRDSGDFIVEAFLLPEELEDQLLDEAEEQATGALERRVDPEPGEVIIPEAPDIAPSRLSDFEDQIEIRDVTPHDFGRIAAQTAKQVILQRIREAERDMMFEEYRDRVGELITGIVQQSDSRYTLVQLRERVEALLPKSEQVDGERYDHSQRIKAVIKEVSPSTKGPAIIVSRRPLQDRRRLPHRRGRPGGRVRRPARLARADGRLRAARREDRHHPVQRRARPVRRQGPESRARAGGPGRRR